jgi:hypothetical protein
MANKTIKAFNAKTQKEEDATVTVDESNEYVFTFKDKSFFKLPANFTKKQIEGYLKKHFEDNIGQVKTEDILKEKAANQKVLESL